MKHILIFISLFIGFSLHAQVLGYGDMGVLLTNESNQQGTARSMAMKNAFGALGGDLSSISINPAGAAVFSSSNGAISLGIDSKNVQSSFYTNNISSTSNKFNLSQLGTVFLIKDDVESKRWKKITLGVNLNKTSNFNNSWIANGKSLSTWVYNPTDPAISYTQVDSQKFTNITSGTYSKIDISLASQYSDYLYLGASIQFHDLEYIEDSKLKELANDGTGNSVDAFQSFWQESKGDGFSMGVGIIVKPIQNLRLGFSYKSPVWNNISETSNMFYEDENDTEYGYYDIIYSNEPDVHYENSIDKVLAFDYKLRTPSKITGSFAYIFGKKGLISADLTSKNYKNIILSPTSEFTSENQDFQNNLINSIKLNLGTEWRYKKLSARGGYSYQSSPYADAIKTDNILGYALGLGYNFGKYSLDFAYNHNQHTDYFDFYPRFNDINGAELTRSHNKFITTLSVKF